VEITLTPMNDFETVKPLLAAAYEGHVPA